MASSLLGAAIAKRRAECNMSQEKLAGEAGVHPNTVKELERSEHPNPRLTTLEAIARTLGLTFRVPPDAEASAEIEASGAIPSAAHGTNSMTNETWVPAPDVAELARSTVWLRQLGDGEQARTHFAQLLASRDGDETVFHYAAVQAERLGENQIARALYARALELNPEDLYLRCDYADYLSKTGGRPDEADCIFTGLSEQAGDDAEVIGMYLDHLARYGRSIEAKEQLGRLKALAFKPRSPETARFSYLVALSNHRRVLNLPPEELGRALAEMANFLTQQDQVFEGTRPDERVRQSARLLAMIATIQAELGEFDNALENYRLASQCKLEDPAALRRLAADLRRYWDLPSLGWRVLRAALQQYPADRRTWEDIIAAAANDDHTDPRLVEAMLRAAPGRERLELMDDAFNALRADLGQVLAEVGEELKKLRETEGTRMTRRAKIPATLVERQVVELFDGSSTGTGTGSARGARSPLTRHGAGADPDGSGG